jgi:CRP-like cAMP-binding protein
MPVTVTHDDLARAVRKLRAHAADTGAWLEVAALLHALGATDDAELAFAAIGEAARAGGRVALAVACARHLAELGSVRGPELVDAIIETYATGGPRVASSPPRARPATEPPPLDEELADPLAEARAVVARLTGWLTSRPAGQVSPAPLLSALPAAAARALVGVTTARAFPAGARIIEVGEPAAALYWIAHGTVAVTRDAPGGAGETALGELHSGAFFGEIALVGGTRRTARVAARDDVWLLEIPARAIATAAERHPRLADVLAFHARARLLANLTRTSELFRALGEVDRRSQIAGDGAGGNAPRGIDREALLARLSTELVPAGTRFITEGAANEHLWVVVAGRCEIRTAGGAIAELGPGAAVGEISLVSGRPAVADVVAVEPAVLLRLSKRDFDAVASLHPSLLAEVERLVVERETQNRALFQDASDLIV